MKFKALGLAGVGISLLAVPALGHHPSASIDYEQTVEFTGTVKVFRWTNPHSWLYVMTADEGGQMVEWELEMGSPGPLSRSGWNPRTVAPGEDVTVTLYPLKDGSPGGQLITVETPEGTVMSGEAPPKPATNAE